MAEIDFPDASESPWTAPNSQVWVHDGDGWLSDNGDGSVGNSDIYQELAPDLSLYDEGQGWVRTRDMTRFHLYEDADSKQWVSDRSPGAGTPGKDGIIGVDGVDGDDGMRGLSPYISDGTDGFVIDNWITDDDNDGVYTDSGKRSRGLDGGDPLLAFPVGAIYLSISPTTPDTLFGGTWVAIGAGRMLVGVDPGDSAFDAPKLTGGAKTHALVTGEMPAHTHTANHNHDGDMSGSTDTDDHVHSIDISERNSGLTNGEYPVLVDGGSPDIVSNSSGHNHSLNGSISINTENVTTSSTGSGTAHNIMSPYITTYMWERTA